MNNSNSTNINKHIAMQNEMYRLKKKYTGYLYEGLTVTCWKLNKITHVLTYFKQFYEINGNISTTIRNKFVNLMNTINK